jgi:pentatricopeptide repeat protein
MREEGINPNLISYNAAFNALSKAARTNMQRATRYHHMNGGAGTIALDTDKQELWKRALVLFDRMKNEGILPDSFTYSGVISTLGSCGKLQDALTLIEEMRSVGKANKVSYTAAIGASLGAFLLTL